MTSVKKNSSGKKKKVNKECFAPHLRPRRPNWEAKGKKHFKKGNGLEE